MHYRTSLDRHGILLDTSSRHISCLRMDKASTRALVEVIGLWCATMTEYSSLSGFSSLLFPHSRYSTRRRRACTSCWSCLISLLPVLSSQCNISSHYCYRVTSQCLVACRYTSSCPTEAFQSMSFHEPVVGGYVDLWSATGWTRAVGGGSLAAAGCGAEGVGWLIKGAGEQTLWTRLWIETYPPSLHLHLPGT